MIERHLDIATADGAMNSFVVHPEEGGPFPVVLFYMDAPGKREELHDMARRIAAVGYFVVLPNLYYRQLARFELRERDRGGMAHMFSLMAHARRRTTECDTRAMLRFVDAQPGPTRARRRRRLLHERPVRDAGPRRRSPSASRCIASIHGANMVTDRADSPHRIASKIRCESYFACAEIDKWAPPRRHRQARRPRCAAAATPHRIEWYPGVEHGFVFPQRAGIYDQAAAERHWERLFALFARTLDAARR